MSPGNAVRILWDNLDADCPKQVGPEGHDVAACIDRLGVRVQRDDGRVVRNTCGRVRVSGSIGASPEFSDRLPSLGDGWQMHDGGRRPESASIERSLPCLATTRPSACPGTATTRSSDSSRNLWDPVQGVAMPSNSWPPFSNFSTGVGTAVRNSFVKSFNFVWTVELPHEEPKCASSSLVPRYPPGRLIT